MRPMFSPEELAEMAAADAEIDASFSLTNEDIKRSREADKAAMFDRLPPEKKKIAAYQRAYYEANREEIAAKKRAYYEANREEIAAYQRAYREAKRDGGKRRGADAFKPVQRDRWAGPGGGNGRVSDRGAVRMGGLSDKGVGKALAGGAKVAGHSDADGGEFL